jgi:hypothetical protein
MAHRRRISIRLTRQGLPDGTKFNGAPNADRVGAPGRFVHTVTESWTYGLGHGLTPKA